MPAEPFPPSPGGGAVGVLFSGTLSGLGSLAFHQLFILCQVCVPSLSTIPILMWPTLEA